MTDRNPVQPPLLITGCQRSGTTLLRNLLGNHPRVLAHPKEPQFILGLHQRFGRRIRDVQKAVSYVSGHSYCPPSVDPESLAIPFRGLKAVGLQDFLRGYLETWGGKEIREKRPMLKHPQLVFHLDLISTLFPGIGVLHIVRDPRAAVLSQCNRWPQITVWEAAMLWRKAVRAARSWGIRHPSRYIEVQYEHLVKDPASTLEAQLYRIGLPFTEEMLTCEYSSPEYVEGRIVGATVFRGTDPTRVDRWSSSLSGLEIRQIEHGCRREMQWWGYRPQAPQVSLFSLAASVFLQRVRLGILGGGRWVKSFGRRTGWRLGLAPL